MPVSVQIEIGENSLSGWTQVRIAGGVAGLLHLLMAFLMLFRHHWICLIGPSNGILKEKRMDINALVDHIKRRPDYYKVGMILCHNGVVRGTSRDGRKVTGLRVAVDQDTLDRVVQTHKERPGIIEILVQINSDCDLKVGDDVMLLAVAGDIRENVTAALSDTLNAIKSTVTNKTEYFSEP
jgi:molybdopterin synthase catalytic subunit